jgi:hypothetical protein
MSCAPHSSARDAPVTVGSCAHHVIGRAERRPVRRSPTRLAAAGPDGATSDRRRAVSSTVRGGSEAGLGGLRPSRWQGPAEIATDGRGADPQVARLAGGGLSHLLEGTGAAVGGVSHLIRENSGAAPKRMRLRLRSCVTVVSRQHEPI